MAKAKSTKESEKELASKATKKTEEPKKEVKAKEAKAEKAEKAEKVEKPTKTKKSKKNLFIGLGVGVLAIGAIVACFCIFAKTIDPADKRAKLSYSNSFFVADDNVYTLYNSAGVRITSDEYTNKSDFLAGCAAVQKDGQYAVIRENGTLAVDFGRYGEIAARGGLYYVKDGNTKLYSVITCDGKVLAQGADITMQTYGYNNGFALVESEKQYDLFTWAGVRLVSLQKEDGADDPILDASNDFGTLYYNGQNFVFDARTSQMLAAFEGYQFSIDDVSESRSQILLETDEENVLVKHKMLTNGEIYDLSDTENYGFVNEEYLIGYNDFEKVALLDNEYKLVKYVGTYLSLKDLDNYAVLNDDDDTEDNTADIFYRGEVVTSFGLEPYVVSGILYDDYYLIRDNGKFRFYNLDGTVASFSKEYVSALGNFNKRHHAIVADEENKYYLINTQGQQINEGTYRRIYLEDGGYEIKNDDDKYGILNLDGQLVVEPKYTSVYYRSAAVDHAIWTGRNAYNDYDVIDAGTGKVILEHANVQNFYAHYFTVTNADKKTEYYTYDGTLFYTTK